VPLLAYDGKQDKLGAGEVCCEKNESVDTGDAGELASEQPSEPPYEDSGCECESQISEPSAMEL
jgi:hypothetical protein